MRLVTYLNDGSWRAGAIIDGHVVDAERALVAAGRDSIGTAPTMRALLDVYGADLDAVASAIAGTPTGSAADIGPLNEITLGPVVADPEKVLCIGLNYGDHVAETGRSLPQYPDVFTKFPGTLIGANDAIGGLDVTEQLDFEGELAIVIGREAKNVSADDATSVIAGVSILNDITARDLQYRGTQWVVGKSVDGTTPVGPDLVTLDEVGDVQALDISTRVNGAVKQHSNTRHMIFPVAEIIAYLTRTITLKPGDIIATGTPDGIGAKRTPPEWLRSGDVVEVELQNVGTLRSVVA
ncbi:fumarylacetoacetate hydrolase family protein [Streptomyces carpinensis]|uniref:Fumarylacetoacetate hydrolase family protein n=1 Tax=Streptomyces carpinensis TaxID=66369 RepID=A0ABV1W0B2_9ACTN|nr:fumarylacetoacetate hydrolase family protein [Streptomyces carpinensis]